MSHFAELPLAAQVAEQSSSSTEQVSGSTQETSASTQETADLARAAGTLVARFKVTA
jgi:methyl-accepting chemotaxis protein